MWLAAWCSCTAAGSATSTSRQVWLAMGDLKGSTVGAGQAAGQQLELPMPPQRCLTLPPPLISNVQSANVLLAR